MIMKEMLHELREIRKELQAIRSSLESSRRYAREPYGRKFIPLLSMIQIDRGRKSLKNYRIVRFSTDIFCKYDFI